jgi:hypothetical protein
MQPAITQQTPWVTIAIFGLTGGIAGMFTGGPAQAAFGVCLGIVLGSLGGPRMVQMGYLAAAFAFVYTCMAFYTVAVFPDFQSAQVQSLHRSVPVGTSFDNVYRYLKIRHAKHVSLATYVASAAGPDLHSKSSMLVADYQTRFLLSNFRFRTKFLFDKHEHLYRCWISDLQ